MRPVGYWKQITSIVLVFSLLSLLLPSSPATAGWIRTEVALEGPQARLISLIERQDIAAAFRSLGIDPAEARRRAGGLTDAEAQVALERLDGLPAGGVIGAVITAFVIVFLILLLTDILGFTDVFPFVKKTVR